MHSTGIPLTPETFALIGFLAILEGILSVDNALVLALMVKHLPAKQQKLALTYGLAGSIVFRLIALGLITQLMKWNWIQFVGGGYLLIVAGQHLLRPSEKAGSAPTTPKGRSDKASFWFTVFKVELMDIAFAIDSILAAVALSNNFWIVFIGGMMGVLLMRFAATGFLTLLRRFPNFEKTAYLLIAVVGLKLVIGGFHFEGFDFHSSSSPAFWVFWGLMISCLIYGFAKRVPDSPEESKPDTK